MPLSRPSRPPITGESSAWLSHTADRCSPPRLVGTPVRRNRLLAALPAEERRYLEAWLEPVRLVHRRLLAPAGAPLHYVYFPQSGLVSLLVSTQSGASVEAAAIGRDGMLGISGLLEGGPPPYDMCCVVPGTALRLPSAIFVQAGQHLPVFRGLVSR